MKESEKIASNSSSVSDLLLCTPHKESALSCMVDNLLMGTFWILKWTTE